MANEILDLSNKLTPPQLRRNPAKNKTNWHNWKTAVSIIKIYQDMLKTAEQLGYGRNKTETPYEFLTTLKNVWPENQQETKIITQAYVNIKYGQFPESKDELQKIKDSWQKIKTSQSTTYANEKS